MKQLQDDYFFVGELTAGNLDFLPVLFLVCLDEQQGPPPVLLRHLNCEQ